MYVYVCQCVCVSIRQQWLICVCVVSIFRFSSGYLEVWVEANSVSYLCCLRILLQLVQLSITALDEAFED